MHLAWPILTRIFSFLGSVQDIEVEIQSETGYKIIINHGQAQRWNSEIILKFSTAYPFKTRYSEIKCSYCSQTYDSMSDLRNHHRSNHQNMDINKAFCKLHEYLKIDITDLKCKICSADMDNVNNLMEHLSQEHSIKIHFDVPYGVFPYKEISNGEWLCVYCDKIFSEFLLLNRHIVDHFKNFTCDKCGSSFVTENTLRNHNRVVKCFKTNYKARESSVSNSRNNAHIILKCSTAYPFRIWQKNFSCIFCRVQSIDPNGLRHHMNTRHANYDITKAFYKRLGNDFIKIDITNLQCKLCLEIIPDLECLVDHLREAHQQPLSSDGQHGVLPFFLKEGIHYKCAICPNEFADFDSLSKHTLVHFQNFVCDTCGEGFITESSLLAHTKIPHENKFKCNRCVAAFATAEERSAHFKANHPTNLYTCTHCKDKPRFPSWNTRRHHLIEVHNYVPGSGSYECTTCQKSFKSRSAKYNHMERTHRVKKDPEVKYTCGQCPKTFATKHTLETHIAKKHYDV